MPRLQLFEFCDQAWLPQTLRQVFVETLDMIHEFTGNYRGVANLVARVAREIQADHLVDLASGGAGHLDMLLEEASDHNINIPKVIASDLHPIVGRWQRLRAKWGGGRFDYIECPVVANDTLPSGTNFCSIFSAFHHFDPDYASKFLSTTLAQVDAMIIGEISTRSWACLFYMVAGFPLIVLSPFVTGTFSWRRLFWVTVCPVASLIVMFDGVVTSLRTYTPVEIWAMVPDEVRQHFDYNVMQHKRLIGFSSWSMTIIRKK